MRITGANETMQLKQASPLASKIGRRSTSIVSDTTDKTGQAFIFCGTGHIDCDHDHKLDISLSPSEPCSLGKGHDSAFLCSSQGRSVSYSMTDHSTSYENPFQEELDSAAKIVDQLSRDTKFFDDQREKEFPRFTWNELGVGTLLGRGGFCTVHEIRNIRFEKSFYSLHPEPQYAEEEDNRNFMRDRCLRNGEARYAVKKLYVRPEVDRRLYSRGHVDLALEVKFLAVLDHPHIVKLRAVCDQPPCTENYFIIMDRLFDTLETRLVKWKRDYNRSKSVKKKILGGTFKMTDEKSIKRFLVAYDIAQAVGHLHSNSIIYRDLKPENIGFDVRDDVKIFDFGLAKELRPEEAMEDGRYRLTQMTGSLRYMAPEVATYKTYNLSADVYSFGILLWQIMSMEIPFCKFNSQLHREHVIQRGNRPEIPEKWPVTWRGLMRFCWAQDYRKRPTMAQVLDELRANVYVLQGGDDTCLNITRRTNKSASGLDKVVSFRLPETANDVTQHE